MGVSSSVRLPSGGGAGAGAVAGLGHRLDMDMDMDMDMLTDAHMGNVLSSLEDR